MARKKRPRPTDFRNAPTAAPIELTFADFCLDLLPAWSNDAPIEADTVASSAKQAAQLALYRAALTERGTILVIAPSSEVTAVKNFISAMVASQPMLKGVDRRIEICTQANAPTVRNALHVIELRPDERPMSGPIDKRNLARTLLHVYGREPRWEAKIEQLTDVEPGTVASLREQVRAEFAEREAQLAAAELERAKAKPTVPEEQPGPIVDGLYTEQTMEADAMRRMMGPTDPAPNVIWFPRESRR